MEGGAHALRGRSTELGALRLLLDEAAAGRLATGIVEGEAGIGKSRLLGEVLDDARGRGFVVFRGRAQELARGRQFGALVDALACVRSSPDMRRAAIARELTTPSAGAAADPGLRFRVLETFVELLEEEGLAAPLVLALEDVHWADLSTLVAVGAIEQRLAYVPLVLLVSLRPIPRSREVDGLIETLARGGATHLMLGPLDAGAVAELVHDILDASPGPSLAQGLAGAAGNPLFVTELVRALELDGAIRLDAGTAEVSGVVIPPGLRLTIIRRIGFLPAETLDALRVSSILGATFSLADVSTVTGRLADDLYADLRPAYLAGVLEDSQGSLLRFRHDLIRDAIYEDMPESLRVVVHRDAARKLSASGASAVQIAEQFERAHDADAATWLGRAALEVGAASPAAAAALLDRAAALAAPGERDALLEERGVSLFWAGLNHEAEAVLRAVIDRRPDRARARTALARVLIAQDRIPEALAELEAAVALETRPSDTAEIQAWTGHCRLILGDLDGAREIAATALAASESAGDEATACNALCCLAAVENWRGRFADAVRLTARAMALGGRGDGTAHRIPVGAFHGLYLIDVDRVADGLAAVQRGARISEERGARWNLALHHSAMVFAHHLLGDWDEALAELDTTSDLASESGWAQGQERNHAIRAMIFIHRGELTAAAEAVEAAEREHAGVDTGPRLDWPLWARALLLESGGDVVGACGALREAWDLFSGTVMGSQLPVLGDLIRMAVAVGARDLAREVVTAVEDFAGRQRFPWVTATALRSRALLEPSSDAWTSAVEAWRESPRVLDRAMTLEDAGAADAKDGRIADARARITEAIAIYESLQAMHDIARADARLRALGVRRGARGARRRPLSGWESLTRSEIRVVPHIAEGMTNRQIADRLFVSPRTVQTHIAHIFEKLGVTSRVEIASQAALRGVV